jgi:hypothetical protein
MAGLAEKDIDVRGSRAQIRQSDLSRLMAGIQLMDTRRRFFGITEAACWMLAGAGFHSSGAHRVLVLSYGCSCHRGINFRRGICRRIFDAGLYFKTKTRFNATPPW